MRSRRMTRDRAATLRTVGLAALIGIGLVLAYCQGAWPAVQRTPTPVCTDVPDPVPDAEVYFADESIDGYAVRVSSCSGPSDCLVETTRLPCWWVVTPTESVPHCMHSTAVQRYSSEPGTAGRTAWIEELAYYRIEPGGTVRYSPTWTACTDLENLDSHGQPDSIMEWPQIMVLP